MCLRVKGKASLSLRSHSCVVAGGEGTCRLAIALLARFLWQNKARVERAAPTATWPQRLGGSSQLLFGARGFQHFRSPVGLFSALQIQIALRSVSP